MHPKVTGWTRSNEKTITRNNWFCVTQCDLTHESGATLEDFQDYAMRDCVQVIGIAPGRRLVLISEDRKTGGQQILTVYGDIEEKDQDPSAAAVRELWEETGFKTQELIHIGSALFDTNRARSLTPGSYCFTCHSFVAHELHREAPHRQPSEMIEAILVPFDEALDCTLRPSNILKGHNRPILDLGTQNIIKTIALRPELRRLLD